MHLIAHILRTLVPHAERFADLPLKTVPSAAVSDKDTAQWSLESYTRDIEADSELPDWRAS